MHKSDSKNNCYTDVYIEDMDLPEKTNVMDGERFQTHSIQAIPETKKVIGQGSHIFKISQATSRKLLGENWD